MTSLAFDVFWRDHGAQKGLQGLGRQADTTKTSFDRAHRSIHGGMAGAATATAKFGKVGVLALASAGVAAAGLGSKVVTLASKFESSMRLVGVTTGQSGKGLKDLTKIAIEMGAKTSFSAQGAADAMLALAKGGLTAAQIKAGALQQTLTLATAGGLELGNAANFMVQGLNAFGLKAKDAGQVAAALAGGANASTASVESMGMALSQVGAQSHTVGLSLQDTTAALAAFANAGIQGSDAGTSLKTFLQRLLPTTEKATYNMKKLGLITKDGKNQFFDAAGNIKSMTQVSGLLADALKGQTKQQKLAALTTIFGSDASRAAAVLTDEGAKGLAKYVKATSDKKAAEELAKNATLGYAGALERFKGSVETAGIQLGTKFLPTLSTMLDFLSSKALPALSRVGTDLAPAFKTAGASLGAFWRIGKVVFTAFAEAMTGSKATFGNFAGFISTHQGDIVGAFVAGSKAALVFGKAIATGSSIGLRAFATVLDGMTSGTQSVLELIGTIAKGTLAAFGWIPGLGPKLKAANDSFMAFGQAGLAGARKAAAGARTLADGIDHKVVPAISKAQGGLDKIGRTEIVKAAMRDAVSKASIAIRDLGTKADGSQLKLHRFNLLTRLGTGEQAALRARLATVKGALGDQVRAMQAAGAGQASLSRAWKTGRDRLYDEFRQMGLSKTEARKLAAQYAGIKPKVRTEVTQPGMAKARADTRDLDNRINGINSKKVAITFSTNAYKIGKTKFAVNLTAPSSVGRSAGGGLIQGPGTGTSDSILGIDRTTGVPTRWVSNKEFVVNAKQTAKHLDLLRAINDGVEGAAAGGLVRHIQTGVGGVPRSAMQLPGVFRWFTSAFASSAGQMLGKALAKGLASTIDSGGLGDPAHVTNPRGLTRYHGGTFTRQFAAGLKAAGVGSIFQGGFRPTTSFSGSTHNMDAVDVPVNYGLLRRFRRIVGAMGDRTGLGNWASHMHGVPAPGHGYGSPSARAQYQDYLRRGGARQSPKSPWGLAGGGVVSASFAEHGPERVLSARQTQSFDNLVRTISAAGGAPHVEYHLHAPNYIGSRDDLRRALVDMARSGQLEVIRR